MPPVKGRMFRYSEADMEAAIQECKRGVPTSTAAKKFRVPRVTLLNKVKGKTPMKRKMGRTCYISDLILNHTELEDEKKSRAEERKRKKEETEKARKLKTDMKLLKKSKNIIKNKFKKTDYNSSTTKEEWVESGDSLDDISDEVTDEENKEERNEEERNEEERNEEERNEEERNEEEGNEEERNKEDRNEEESRIKQSDYVIVKFPGKKRYYKCVCIVQKVNKTEIEVMAMIACDMSKTVFKENDRDISAITESQIIKVLDVPNMIITGDRIKYKFDSALEIDG